MTRTSALSVLTGIYMVAALIFSTIKGKEFGLWVFLLAAAIAAVAAIAVKTETAQSVSAGEAAADAVGHAPQP